MSSLGVYSGKLVAPYEPLYAGLGDQKIVTTLCPGGKERMRRLMALIQNHRVDLSPLVTHRFGLDDIHEAYDLFAAQRDGVMKIALTPHVRPHLPTSEEVGGHRVLRRRATAVGSSQENGKVERLSCLPRQSPSSTHFSCEATAAVVDSSFFRTSSRVFPGRRAPRDGADHTRPAIGPCRPSTRVRFMYVTYPYGCPGAGMNTRHARATRRSSGSCRPASTRTPRRRRAAASAECVIAMIGLRPKRSRDQYRKLSIPSAGCEPGSDRGSRRSPAGIRPRKP